jgi:hypothetical protein
MSRWPRGTLYPQKLAITSLTSGGRSVNIVRSRTQTMEFSFFFWCTSCIICSSVSGRANTHLMFFALTLPVTTPLLYKFSFEIRLFGFSDVVQRNFELERLATHLTTIPKARTYSRTLLCNPVDLRHCAYRVPLYLSCVHIFVCDFTRARF